MLAQSTGLCRALAMGVVHSRLALLFRFSLNSIHNCVIHSKDTINKSPFSTSPAKYRKWEAPWFFYSALESHAKETLIPSAHPHLMRALTWRIVCNTVDGTIFQAIVPHELFPMLLAVAHENARSSNMSNPVVVP